MEFLDIANRYIPGYRLLSRQEKKAFLRTESGQQFFAAVNHTLSLVKNVSASLAFWQKLFFSEEAIFEQVKADFLERKRQLLAQISQGEAYQQVVKQIIWEILGYEYPDFEYLTDEQQELLVGADFSKVLQTGIPPLYEKGRQLINTSFDFSALEEIRRKKEEVITDWEAVFLSTPEMQSLKETITEQKERIRREQIAQEERIRQVETARKERVRQEEIAQKISGLDERAGKLALFFPLLNTPLPPNAESSIAVLRARYRVELQKQTPNTAHVEEMLVTEVVFHYLQQATAKNLPSEMVLRDFNQEQANRIAKDIMEAYNDEEELELEDWLQVYKEKLATHIIEKLFCVNGKTWETPSETPAEVLANSLSYLWNNRVVGRAEQLVNKLADAHAFIQATSFATQNESSFLAVLDLYNYSRFADQINENKAIIASLLSPFRPIYDEYRDIGLYEKDMFLKLVRMVMPMVVAVAVVIVVAVILGPLAIPDLAFTLTLIPTLLIALGVAAKYVMVKNDIYQKGRQLLHGGWHGGVFDIPEFQISPRMISAFDDPENSNREKAKTVAVAVREFYIKEFKRCEEQEAFYQSKGSLSELELSGKKANFIRRRTLWLEWYDIHSNLELGHDSLPKIILARLYEVGNTAFQGLKKALEGERDNGESVQLNSSVNQLVSEVTTKLTTSTPQEAPVVNREERGVAAVVVGRGLPVVQAPINHTPRLFRPSPLKCLALHKEMEEVDLLARNLSPIASH